jgi:hypothetical protein
MRLMKKIDNGNKKQFILGPPFLFVLKKKSKINQSLKERTISK